MRNLWKNLCENFGKINVWIVSKETLRMFMKKKIGGIPEGNS